ncbi:MAG: HAD-IIIC family phosphatase [Magnetococcales bacterium]|nr:HAD-IIIC family phosphatase [Magnetococcales bacterium]
MIREARQAFLSALEQNRAFETRNAAWDYLTRGEEAGRWRVVARVVRELPEGALGLKTLRVAVLASFAIDFLQDALLALGLAHGLRVVWHVSGFAQYHQEILDPDSGLYAFRPDVVILAIEGERLLPHLYAEAGALPVNAVESGVAAAMGVIDPLITALKKHSGALLLIHDLVGPPERAWGILEGMNGPGATEVIQGVRAALLERARSVRGLHVVDYSGLVARYGVRQWFDRRMAHLAQSPIAAPMLPRLAGEYLKYLRAVAGLTRKCLVTDLDHTLWGGIVGEDGLHGLKLGPTYPGSAHLAYQRLLLQLHQRGVLLAIASKNNPQDVAEVFRDHPAMLLKPHHFARQEIHWQPKSQSLRAIAQGLNIGLEHLVFVDDNPAECAEVRAALPMVTVIVFPARPEEAVELILEPGWFDALTVSEEDRNRSALYEQRDRAEALKMASGSLQEYYVSLEMGVEMVPVTAATVARAAQLTQKTNQFNLTTRRHSEEELARRLNDPDWLVCGVRVIDRFGDNGVVGLMMAKALDDQETLEVETFLLSCRVIGRTIETAMLAELCQGARRMHRRRIRGCCIPTARNAPAQTLYPDHGFIRASVVSENANQDETFWELDLACGEVTTPPWITRIGADHGRTDQTTDG